MMKGIKNALTFLHGALYASLWWAALRWGTFAGTSERDDFLFKLFWLPTALWSVVLVIIVVTWLVYNWDKE